MGYFSVISARFQGIHGCSVGIPRNGRFVVNSEVGVEGSWRVKGFRLLGVSDPI